MSKQTNGQTHSEADFYVAITTKIYWPFEWMVPLNGVMAQMNSVIFQCRWKIWYFAVDLLFNGTNVANAPLVGKQYLKVNKPDQKVYWKSCYWWFAKKSLKFAKASEDWSDK